MLGTVNITADDHRDFVATMALTAKVRKVAIFTKVMICGVAFVMIVALAKFLWVLGVIVQRGIFVQVIGILSDYPYLLPLFIAGLIMVPVAFLVLRLLNQQRRNINSALRDDFVDESFLRDGYNIGDTRYELDDEGICISQTFVEDFYCWEAFRDFKESQENIFLIINANNALIVPKRAFGDGGGDLSIKDFIAHRIGANP